MAARRTIGKRLTRWARGLGRHARPFLMGTLAMEMGLAPTLAVAAEAPPTYYSAPAEDAAVSREIASYLQREEISRQRMTDPSVTPAGGQGYWQPGGAGGAYGAGGYPPGGYAPGGYPPGQPGMGGPGYQGGSPGLNVTNSIDPNTSVNVYGNPDPEANSFGTQVMHRSPGGIIRSFEVGTYANDDQMVISAGGTTALFERDGFGIGARGLVNGADYGDRTRLNQAFGASGDLFMGKRCYDYFGNEHWFKVGGFIDSYYGDEQYGKYGPTFSAIFFANERPALTFDFALGFGYGDDRSLLPIAPEVLSVADRDYQVRIGGFVNPCLQLGVSGNVYEWTDGHETEYGAGPFANMMLGNWRLGLDFSTGQGGARGFANVAYLFGPKIPTGTLAATGVPGVNGQAWLFQPTQRDITVRLGSRRAANINGITLVTAQVFQPPRLSNNATFELDLRVTNQTNQTIQNVSFGQNAVVTGTAGATIQGLAGTTVNAVGPGETATTNQITDLNIVVPPNAAAGQTIIVEFDVTANGQTRRVRLAPLVVGGINNGQIVIGQIQ